MAAAFADAHGGLISPRNCSTTSAGSLATSATIFSISAPLTGVDIDAELSGVGDQGFILHRRVERLLQGAQPFRRNAWMAA